MTRFIKMRTSKFHLLKGTHLQIKKTHKTNLKILNNLICLEFQNNIFYFCKVTRITSHFYIIEDEFRTQKKTSINKIVSINLICNLTRKLV